MFTGLIEHVGVVAGLDPIEGGYRFGIETELAAHLKAGDSISVNGVCLTVTAIAGHRFETEVGPETARVTTLGACTKGTLVNLERPMRPDGHMGGHFVLGHVDATGVLTEVTPDGEFYWIRVAFDPSFSPYFIPKGSVAVDGISLTVANLYERDFTVQIIPFTWDHTNLRGLHVGDRVNLEVDVIGKYVVRVAQLSGAWPGLAAIPPVAL